MNQNVLTKVKQKRFAAKTNNNELVAASTGTELIITGLAASWTNAAKFWVHEEGTRTSGNTYLAVEQSTGGNIMVNIPGRGARLGNGKDLDVDLSATSGVVITAFYTFVVVT